MQFTARISRASAKALLAALGAAFAISLPAAAKQSDRNEPVDIHSLVFDGSQQPQGIAIYEKNVIITQGTLKITGNKATAYFDKDNQLTRVVVDGNPATMHQLDDDNQPMDGSASNIDYKIDTDFAVLTGNAKVKQPAKGSAEGDKLTYNTKDSTMTGQSNGGVPVHMTFQPKNKSPAASPATPAKADTPATDSKKP